MDNFYFKNTQAGDVCKGTIFSEDNQNYYLDIPGKYSAKVKRSKKDLLNIDEEYSVKIISIDDEAGFAEASIIIPEEEDAYLEIENAWKNKINVNAIILGDNNKHLFIGYFSPKTAYMVSGLLPKWRFSKAELDNIPDSNIVLSIRKFDPIKKHIMFDRPIYKNRIEDLKKNDKIECIVTNVNEKIGVFVRPKRFKASGLIHNSNELKALKNPLKTGDHVLCTVINCNIDAKKIKLKI